MAKRFAGMRFPHGCVVVVMDEHGERKLDPRYDLRKHSPDGFEWGYGGSGPAQLALALCAECCISREQALDVYHEVKRTLVASWRQDSWEITKEELDAVLAPLLRARTAKRIKEAIDREEKGYGTPEGTCPG
jgi:hypothetical protein